MIHLTPKILHTTVSHKIIIANSGRGYGVGCGFGFMGSIFYVLSVVDCNTYFIDTKMGGGI